jgi:hypothetical protein
MKTTAWIAALAAISMLAGCAPAGTTQRAPDHAESTRYSGRPAYFLVTQTRADPARTRPADLPQTRHVALRSK